MPSFPEVAGGYNGKLLRVNLTTKTVTTEKLGYIFCRQYMGGAGFVAYYLWKELKPKIDPLGPDNKIVFALGPVSGLQLPGAARYCIGTKSPLTGTIAKSESGGFWMAELKRAGFDAIIVEGKADKPVYIFVQDGEASIKDATHLWGKETKEAEEAIRAELGDEHVQVALIGPAGENLVRYACVMTGLHDAAGRGGIGAVMGSKNLKAIAARGHKQPEIADGDRLKEIRQQMLARPAMMGQLGTGGPDMVMGMQSGNLPVRNFRDGQFPDVDKIHAGVIKDTIRVGMEGCYACHVRCKKVVKFEEPYKCDPVYGGPEYETLASLGSDCGVNDLKAICKGNERCNAYSLDTISTGSTIAFAMECFERGLLTKKDTGGIELKFGNADAMLQAIELLARREGFGDMLAEGTKRMSEKIGKGSEEFAMHTKGLEPGMHDPRARQMPGLGIGYTLNPHGADHCFSMGSGTSPFGLDQYHALGILSAAPDDLSPSRMFMYKTTHCMGAVKDCLVTCMFASPDNNGAVDLVKAVTGWDTSMAEQLKVGERVLTLMRLFNVREGFTKADDTLPKRYYGPKTDGPLADPSKGFDKVGMDKAREYYYFYMGWDSEGVPRPEKLAELGIQ
jgi:aldehyde:ferredoxin oxidoreductase